VQSLVRTEGPLSLYKGLESQLWRNAVWNGVYFGMIGGLKEEVLRPPPNSDKRTVMGYNFAAGVIGGTLATLVSALLLLTTVLLVLLAILAFLLLLLVAPYCWCCYSSHNSAAPARATADVAAANGDAVSVLLLQQGLQLCRISSAAVLVISNFCSVSDILTVMILMD
jgi:Mitochondrial carrier protein